MSTKCFHAISKHKEHNTEYAFVFDSMFELQNYTTYFDKICHWQPTLKVVGKCNFCSNECITVATQAEIKRFQFMFQGSYGDEYENYAFLGFESAASIFRAD